MNMLEIQPLDDVMSYFQFIFFAYVTLFIIVCVNFFKALYINKKSKENHSIGKSTQIFDLGIDVLCGLAMYTGLMFQGVLADNNALNSSIWSNRLVLISIISFTIFILNVIVVFRKR